MAPLAHLASPPGSRTRRLRWAAGPRPPHQPPEILWPSLPSALSLPSLLVAPATDARPPCRPSPPPLPRPPPVHWPHRAHSWCILIKRHGPPVLPGRCGQAVCCCWWPGKAAFQRPGDAPAGPTATSIPSPALTRLSQSHLLHPRQLTCSSCTLTQQGSLCCDEPAACSRAAGHGRCFFATA